MAVAANPPVPPLLRPVTTLKGVGTERAALLAKLEIQSVEDLLLHRPRRYENRREFRPISQLNLGESATTRGKVVALGTKWFRQHTKSIFEIILEDGTGRLHCRWWNLSYMEKYFARGDEVVVFGKLLSLKPRQIDHPETEVVETGEENFIHLNRITPIYPLTDGLPQRWLRSLIWRTLQRYESQITEPHPELRVVAPPGQPAFPSRATAVHDLHFPETEEALDLARRRLALDELLELQLQLVTRRKNFESKARARPCAGDNHLIKPFLAGLGFKLTDAQTAVLRDIRKDLGSTQPMRRLLQGDVGSGKTVVAACAALMAIESGYDVAVMAPTEILAEQHYANLLRWFEPLGERVELMTSSHKTTDAMQPNLPTATPGSGHQVYVGTHALLESSFAPDNLGLVIIDEQHRFGVAQRDQLVRKGQFPHVLVMTATPIPRTLALTVHGDLETSVIDAPPPGRGRTRSFIRTSDKLPKVWAFAREKLAQGRQAYVVYSRVEDTGQSGIKAVTKELENVQAALAPFRVGLLHGRLPTREKDAVMSAFRSNHVQVLLATSLIEVGVDVPNATLMLIENADQFGLAQLHQLRGRIGRGAHESFCIFIADPKNTEARQRLKVLEQTTDGFQIAEADLALRGPGELLGQQQSGLPPFRFADLAHDFGLLQHARRLSIQFLYGDSPPGLNRVEAVAHPSLRPTSEEDP